MNEGEHNMMTVLLLPRFLSISFLCFCFLGGDVNVVFLVLILFFILRTKEIQRSFYLSVLCRRRAHDVIVWKLWRCCDQLLLPFYNYLFGSLALFYLKLVLFDFISIGERVLLVSFFYYDISFFFVQKCKRIEKVCISVIFVDWSEVFSDKDCTAWYRYYQWCWFMSLCSAFGIVLFQDLTIFFSRQ